MISNKTIIIIQARVNSKRLKNKMLLSLGDNMIIEWVLIRLKSLANKYKIILATTNDQSDNELIKIARNYKIDYFRGSTDNVLLRFIKCADKYKASKVVRVCADNPFIDAEYIKSLIKFDNDDYDYCYNHLSKTNDDFFPNGFGAELFKIGTLNNILKDAKDPKDFEHLSKYVNNHTEKFTIGIPICPANHRFPNLKFDVDTKIDLKYLKNLVEKGVNIKSTAHEILKIARLNGI